MDQIRYHDTSGFKYRLAADYHCKIGVYGRKGGSPFLRLDDDGVLWFSAGYCWDGPSGPTIDTAGAMRPSLIHDGMYELIRLGVLPKEAKDLADEILRQEYIKDATRVVRYDHAQYLASKTDGMWFEGARDWLAQRRYDLAMKVIHLRANAWYAAVQSVGAGGERPPELTAPL